MSHMAVAPLVRLRDLVKAYETPAGRFLALRGVDLDVDAGEFVAVIGKGRRRGRARQSRHDQRDSDNPEF